MVTAHVVSADRHLVLPSQRPLAAALTAVGTQEAAHVLCPGCLLPPPGQPRTTAILCCSLCCISFTSWTTFSVLLAHASKAAACRQSWQLSIANFPQGSSLQGRTCSLAPAVPQRLLSGANQLKGKHEQAELRCRHSYSALKRGAE